MIVGASNHECNVCCADAVLIASLIEERLTFCERKVSMKKLVIIRAGMLGCLFLLFSVSSFANDVKLDAAGEKAYYTIKTVAYFGTGGIGRGGTISPGQLALRVLVRQDRAEDVLVSLLKEAVPAGKMYALVGLKQYYPSVFTKAVAKFKDIKTKLRSRSGCIVEDKTVAAIVAEIKKGWHPILPEVDALGRPVVFIETQIEGGTKKQAEQGNPLLNILDNGLAYVSVSPAELELDAAGDKAYGVLKNVSFFATGGITYGGITSRGELALRILLKQKWAASALKSLLENGHIPGQMYALVGLKEIDPPAFEKAISTYAPVYLPSGIALGVMQEATLETMEGCIGQDKTVSDVVAEIRAGKHRLRSQRELDERDALLSLPITNPANHAHPPHELGLDAAGKKAYNVLRSVSTFATGGIGYGGITSQGELALRILVKQVEAERALESLLKVANPAGRMYALVALKQYYPVFFAEVLPQYESVKTNLQSMSGCILYIKTVASIVAEIKKGRHDVLPKRK